MIPDKNLLQGREYRPAVATDIRLTWAKHCPMWAERMKHNVTPLPIPTVVVHHKAKGM